jgi:hypothetical protein
MQQMTEEEIRTRRDKIIEGIYKLVDAVDAVVTQVDLGFFRSIIRMRRFTQDQDETLNSVRSSKDILKDIFIDKSRISDMNSIRLNESSDAEKIRSIIYFSYGDDIKSNIIRICALFLCLNELDERLKQIQVSNQAPDQGDQQSTDISEPLNDHSCQRDNLV